MTMQMRLSHHPSPEGTTTTAHSKNSRLRIYATAAVQYLFHARVTTTIALLLRVDKRGLYCGSWCQRHAAASGRSACRPNKHTHASKNMLWFSRISNCTEYLINILHARLPGKNHESRGGWVGGWVCLLAVRSFVPAERERERAR